MTSVKRETKQETKKETKTETSDMETHSIWYGRLKNKPSEAKFFKEILNELGKTFIDEDGIKEILSHFWGKTTEELESLIKLQNKREKKVKDKFTTDLSKPKSAYNLYCKYYAAQCKENEIKFTLSNASSTWKTLSDKEKDKFNKAADSQKQEYDIKYKSLKGEAVKNGSFAEDKPKGPTTAFFRFLADNRETIKQILIDNGETEKLNTKITVKAGVSWKALSEKDKEPYERAYREEKDKFTELLETWKTKETSRLKKLDGKTEDIKVEESGDASSVVQEVNPEIQVADKKNAKDNEDEEPTTSGKKSTSKKEPKSEKAPKVKKEQKVAKKVNLTEDEDDEE